MRRSPSARLMRSPNANNWKNKVKIHCFNIYSFLNSRRIGQETGLGGSEIS
jgi:hypothetical protein